MECNIPIYKAIPHYIKQGIQYEDLLNPTKSHIKQPSTGGVPVRKTRTNRPRPPTVRPTN